jgi:hypothetical protein
MEVEDILVEGSGSIKILDMHSEVIKPLNINRMVIRLVFSWGNTGCKKGKQKGE